MIKYKNYDKKTLIYIYKHILGQQSYKMQKADTDILPQNI